MLSKHKLHICSWQKFREIRKVNTIIPVLKSKRARSRCVLYYYIEITSRLEESHVLERRHADERNARRRKAKLHKVFLGADWLKSNREMRPAWRTHIYIYLPTPIYLYGASSLHCNPAPQHFYILYIFLIPQFQVFFIFSVSVWAHSGFHFLFDAVVFPAKRAAVEGAKKNQRTTPCMRMVIIRHA